MRDRRWAAALLALLASSGCAASQTADNAAVCQAYQAGRSHVEVIAAGSVTRLLGVHRGVTSPHEGFLIHLDSQCDVVVRVESNTDFTGDFTLHRGDRVVVKGEYEYYPRGGVIHWTHLDPRGHHEGGFIRLHNRTYE